MLKLAEMVAASALAREKSRGHHWRTDFPNMRRNGKNITIVHKTGPHGEHAITAAPVIR